MKNTRIARLKQSKRVKQATKLLTVGLLVCPLAIGTIKALADESETTPTAEQVEEAPATTEEVAPVEETETSEPVQPVIEQPLETAQPTSDLQTSVTQELAPQSNPVNAWYETEGQTTVTSGDTASYTFYFCTAYDDGSQSREEQTLAEIGVPLISSDPSDVISGNTITFGSSGTRTIQPNLGDTGKLEVTVVNGSFTVSYNTRGNGSLSSYPTISKGDGVWVSLSEMPIPTAGAGSHFKGWEVNGRLNGEWGSSSSIFSGFYVTEDTVVTAVFETGELDWSWYDNTLNQYLGYINLKPAFDEFGFTAAYDNAVQLYNYYVDFKAEKEKDPYLSQEELDRLSSAISGINLNLVDLHFFFEDNITPQITDYFNSLKTVYDDSTTYTPESKQAFNEAWENLQNALNVDAGWYHEMAGGKYTAYQALKTAEQNLIKVADPEIPVDAIVISDDSILLKKGDTHNLSVTFYPENATNKGLIWSSHDESVATVDANGKVTAKGQGTALITATSVENSDASVICTVFVDDDTPPVTDVDTTKLESSIKDAEAKLTAGGYTAQSMNALKQALQNAKDVLANSASTQAEIDEAQKALDLAIAGLVKEDNSSGGNTGNNGSNSTGNSSNDPNTSNNATNNTNNQTSNKQNGTTTTTKPARNSTSKDGLPQTGEQSATNAVIAGLSLAMLSIFAWLKRKKV
ncbi:Ig-like domain-containing protein [Enterococcus sp. BWM-S5]|uniref:Ig-like domain-containing protein n=1 Tax=Enterococcus larvae TaxID=2794352 RepID=A0ABS4CI13_9ENTE|nr:Ig-like domain-containing protein [Enterococcus larvae]MBP1046217.1 Ig-like domain-containing protein [Enterococcus larvae]